MEAGDTMHHVCTTLFEKVSWISWMGRKESRAFLIFFVVFSFYHPPKSSPMNFQTLPFCSPFSSRLFASAAAILILQRSWSQQTKMKVNRCTRNRAHQFFSNLFSLWLTSTHLESNAPILQSLQLEVAAPFPINIIINSAIQAKYNRVGNFLRHLLFCFFFINR